MTILQRSFWSVAAFSGLLLSATASAQSNIFPPNYFSRFSSTELVASNNSGFGVRAFPLPINPDIRISLAKRPHYWEYALSTRQHDTTLLVGVLDNGDTATEGKAHLEVTHDPWKGVQYSGILQNNSKGFASRFSGGYAFTISKDRFRVLNNVGVAFQNGVNAPYIQSEIGGGYGQPVGDKVNVWLGGTVRLFTYPVQKEYQASIDINPSIEVRPLPGLTLNASHLERFANDNYAKDTNGNKQAVIPDLNYGRYQESNASLSYRLTNTNEFSLNMLRTRVQRKWTDKQTFLYNDILFRVNELPVLVGPTIGYQWYPDKASTHWIFSIATAPKQ